MRVAVGSCEQCAATSSRVNHIYYYFNGKSDTSRAELGEKEKLNLG